MNTKALCVWSRAVVPAFLVLVISLVSFEAIAPKAIRDHVGCAVAAVENTELVIDHDLEETRTAPNDDLPLPPFFAELSEEVEAITVNFEIWSIFESMG